MRFPHGILLILLCLVLFLQGCNRPPETVPTDGNVQHVVICWLKNAGNPEQRRQLIDASKALAEIPGVLSIRAGVMLPSERKVVDSSYDVGIIFTFTDTTAMRRYLAHPQHIRAVEETLKPLVGKMIVYDFVE